MARTKKEQPSFEQLLERLEQTVAGLEQGNLPLTELLQKYGEGVELIKACQGILQQAELLLQSDGVKDTRGLGIEHPAQAEPLSEPGGEEDGRWN